MFFFISQGECMVSAHFVSGSYSCIIDGKWWQSIFTIFKQYILSMFSSMRFCLCKANVDVQKWEQGSQSNFF